MLTGCVTSTRQFAAERGIDPDSHIAVYYEKLAQIQSHDGQLTPTVLQQVFSEVSDVIVNCSSLKHTHNVYL